MSYPTAAYRRGSQAPRPAPSRPRQPPAGQPWRRPAARPRPIAPPRPPVPTGRTVPKPWSPATALVTFIGGYVIWNQMQQFKQAEFPGFSHCQSCPPDPNYYIGPYYYRSTNTGDCKPGCLSNQAPPGASQNLSEGAAIRPTTRNVYEGWLRPVGSTYRLKVTEIWTRPNETTNDWSPPVPARAPAPAPLPYPVVGPWADPFVPPGFTPVIVPRPHQYPNPHTYPTPAPRPAPVPSPTVRPRNPWRDPAEQPTRGPRPRPRPRPDPRPRPFPRPRPGDDPITEIPRLPDPAPGVSPQPGGAPVIVQGPGEAPSGHVKPRPQVRPRKGEKEKKVWVGRAAAKYLQPILGTLTETMDFVEAFYKALPKCARPKGFVGPVRQAEAVYKNFELINLRELMINLLTMQVEDEIIGRQGQAMANFSNMTGSQAGYSFMLGRSNKAGPDGKGPQTAAPLPDLIKDQIRRSIETAMADYTPPTCS